MEKYGEKMKGLSRKLFLKCVFSLLKDYNLEKEIASKKLNSEIQMNF